jgi:Recombination directionality factor-like
MASPDSRPTVVVHGGGAAPATLLGQGTARLPTGGKIRAGIKVLTRHAAELPRARAIYEQGVAQGQSFEQIALALADAMPELKSPLVPRNVPWFTVRAQDFPNPALAEQILAAHGEDRGEGVRLYRFPVVFPTDRWQSVMPHELAAWGAHDKRFWSEYSADGRVRHCMTHAPVPVDSTGRRTIRLFGGRKTVLRPDNAGLCQPEACAEYQQRQCNLSGRFLFFIPGIRSISAFELHTNSFYALNAAIQKFETVAFLRGGRIAGFLDSQRTPFYLTKRLMEVAHIDEQGRAVRVPQWIIELEAPVDVSALMRENEDLDTALLQADLATQVLQGRGDALPAGPGSVAAPVAGASGLFAPATPVIPDDATPPTLAQVLGQAADMGIAAEQFQAYAQRRWGPGWMLNPRGRQRAWTELARYVNDPPGYADKIGTELQAAP